MPTVLPARAICALLRNVGLSLSDARVTLTAIALAESGGDVEKVVGTRRGLWQVDDSSGFDRHRIITDAAYAARVAVEMSGVGVTFTPWPSYTNGAYRTFLNAARQGEAQAASVSGSILDEAGTYNPVPRVVPPPPSPGPGQPLTAAFEQPGPLQGLRIIGTEMEGDFASSVIGSPSYSASWTEIPNLSFDIADPQGDLLWRARNIWVRGARVEYMDLDLRIDEIEFSPGPATTGQISITSIDAIVYALRLLRGPRTAKGTSVAEWLRQEMRLAGYDPDRYLLAEQGPTMDIARDVPDESGGGSSGEIPSAWTTAVRLAEETGKRVFVSGRKLIYGSAQFAMQWASTGDLRIGWHLSPEGERWMTLPTAKQTSVGDREGVTEVSGRVPLNRARFFRPGVSVIVHNTPSIAAGDRQFVCSAIEHTIGRDVDGADITLIEPLDPAVQTK